ncbi:hypothetical protein ECG_08352 [Echinococcus granulosus]|nr:hypothetical protein ECG_08352 [Echinococcus granulosus]
MRAVNISEIEVALLMSLLRCLYVYAQWCRARRRCLCASSTEWNGRRASAEAEEEQREEIEEEAEEEDVDWSTSMTPPLSASLTTLTSPVLPPPSPLPSPICPSEEVGDVAEDMSIAAAGRSGEDETAMMALYWETPSGDELSEFTTPSSPHHMVGACGENVSATM